MALPDAKLEILDGALGLTQGAPTAIQAKLGVCSKGTVGELHSFTDARKAAEVLGTGPLVEAVAMALARSGGPVRAMRVNGSVAGAASAVTKTGTGTAVVAVTGTPYDAYDVKMEITRPGATLAAGTAAFKLSLDGGRTYSPEYAVPTAGTFPIPDTGLSLGFTTGTFVAGDVYAFTSTAPGFVLADLTAAVDLLLADPTEWAILHVVGETADAATCASILAALDAKLEGAAAAYRYVRAFIEAPNEAASVVRAGLAASSSLRVGVIFGRAITQSAITGQEASKNAAEALLAHVARLRISEDAGKVARGPVGGVRALVHDERSAQDMDPARFTTLRTHIGIAGVYVTAARMFAPVGSDFT